MSTRLSMALTMVKDVVFWGLGVWMIFNEIKYVAPADLRVEVLILGAVLSGVPGAGVVWAARHGGGGTTGSPSSSPPSQSAASPGTSVPPPSTP